MVASVVDVTSVMVAYTIGIQQSSILLGVAYGIFDAIIVVWMRKPLANAMKSAFRPLGGKSWKSDVYVADL